MENLLRLTHEIVVDIKSRKEAYRQQVDSRVAFPLAGTALLLKSLQAFRSSWQSTDFGTQSVLHVS